VAEGAKGNNISLMRDRDRCCRESAGGDGVLKDAKCGCKTLVLIVESRDRNGMGLVESQKNDPSLRYSKESGGGKANGQ
jgi:hypothetical protein